MYRPQTRKSIITAAKIVHHQHTSSVALSSRNDRAGGGELYIDMAEGETATPVYLRRGGRARS